MTDPAAANAIAIRLARDLSTCTFSEIQTRWPDDHVRNAAGVALAHDNGQPRPWIELVPRKHDPIYYLSQKCYFDNKRGNPRYLYAPYHRDQMFIPIREYILDEDTDYRGVLFLGPRGSYKSTCAGCIALWFALRKYHLEEEFCRIVIRHHKEELACQNLIRVRDKVWRHQWIRWAWEEVCPPLNIKDFGSTKKFSFFNMPRVGEMAEEMFNAVGAKSSWTGGHMDLDIGDDLVTELHITSKRERESAKAAYTAKRYQGEDITREVNMGTLYHPSDVWNMMKGSNVNGVPLYRVIEIPAYKDDAKGNRTFCHPYKLTPKYLEARRQEEISNRGNDMLWWLQYMLTIRMSKQISTRAEWLRRCLVDEIGSNAVPLITCDPCWKGTENHAEGDYASIQVWYLERRGPLVLRYLVDGVHSDELTSLDGENEIFRLMEKWGVVLVTYEEYAGHGLRTHLENEASTRGVSLQLIDLKSKQVKKGARISAFLAEVQARRVFVCEGCDSTLSDELTKQYRDYHPFMDLDDALDGAAQTMDPNVAEEFAPAWNQAIAEQRKRRLGLLPRRQEGNRTRHTQL